MDVFHFAHESLCVTVLQAEWEKPQSLCPKFKFQWRTRKSFRWAFQSFLSFKTPQISFIIEILLLFQTFFVEHDTSLWRYIFCYYLARRLLAHLCLKTFLVLHLQILSISSWSFVISSEERFPPASEGSTKFTISSICSFSNSSELFCLRVLRSV